MSSRLPRTRPSRRSYPRKNIPFGEFLVSLSVEGRQLRLAGEAQEIGARLDRDPNGYCIAQAGRIVARCSNLDTVENWVREQRRAASGEL